MSPPDQAQNILIVDDNHTVTRALSTLLRQQGFEPTVFHTGTEALDYTRGVAPAAAVVDIHLPDISGLIVSQKLRERLGPEALIIVLSGDASMEVLNSLRYVGVDLFYRKPVNAGDLVERLRELMAHT